MFPVFGRPWCSFVMALTAFWDESGTHNGSHFVVVAGYVAPDDQWAEFDPKWHAAQTKWDIHIFHMTDCMTGGGEFRSWAESKRRDCVQDFIRIISDHASLSTARHKYKHVTTIT